MSQYGIKRQENNKMCRLKPGFNWAFLEREPKTKLERLKGTAWRQYCDKTEEMRGAMLRGSITEEQFNEFCKPFLREYAEMMYSLTGLKVTL